jgi:hypothetical protein
MHISVAEGSVMFSTVVGAATLVLVALVMGASFSHALEMPPKMAASGPFWVSCQQNLYRLYRFVVGPAEATAALVVTTFVYFDFVWAGFYAMLIAAISLILAFLVWIAVTERANREIDGWRPEKPPNNWMRWRAQWEYSHLARFGLHLIALASLVVGLLMQIRQG